MCTVLLPPGDNPIAVNKYIISHEEIMDRVGPQRHRKKKDSYICSRVHFRPLLYLVMTCITMYYGLYRLKWKMVMGK